MTASPEAAAAERWLAVAALPNFRGAEALAALLFADGRPVDAIARLLAAAQQPKAADIGVAEAEPAYVMAGSFLGPTARRPVTADWTKATAAASAWLADR